MATSNNGAFMLIKELEELGINLIRDAAMAFCDGTYGGHSEDVVDCCIPKDTKLKREEESLPEGGLVVYIHDTDASRPASRL